ncbi:MAG: hypothetical protein RIG84_00510 [Roseovarius sp.]
MLAAELLCADGTKDFAQIFAHQYVLARGAPPTVAGWAGPEPLEGWALRHCPRLDCRVIEDARGAPCGWLLGVAVDAAGSVVSKSGLRIGAACTARGFWPAVEQAVEPLAGRYIAILFGPGGPRAYFDPVMDMPAVFNPAEGLVASSPLLALRRWVEHGTRLHAKTIRNEGGNYGFQLTCDREVTRGLSNHYLALSDFTLHRHWPRGDECFEGRGLALSETAERLLERLGQVTGALVAHHRCLLPLTGGNDSRTLAYSARESLGGLEGAYAHRVNWITQFDCYLGNQLAEDLGLEFRILDAVKAFQQGRFATKDIRRLKWNFLHATGYIHPPMRSELAAAALVPQEFPEAELVLRGNVMDMTQANQWPRDSLAFELDHAIGKLALGGRTAEENAAYWRDDYLAWMRTLPENARARTYEMAFTELLLPNTLGAKLQGYGRPHYVNPFNDRGLIATCMSVAPELRKKGLLTETLHGMAGAPPLMRTNRLRKARDRHDEVERLFA